MSVAAVSFALDEAGAVAHASTASPAGRFRCLLCSEVIPRVRDSAGTYFRHPERGACDAAGVEREAARRLLAAWVERDLLAHGAVRWRSPSTGLAGAGLAGAGGDTPQLGRPVSQPIARWSAVRCDLHATTGFDVAVVRGDGATQEVVFGFVLLADSERPPATAQPPREGPEVLWLRLDDVVRFRPLVPYAVTEEAEAQAARSGCLPSGAEEGVDPCRASQPQNTLGFLDAAFVEEAGRVQRAWDRVLAAAAEVPRASGWRRLIAGLLVSTRRG